MTTKGKESWDNNTLDQKPSFFLMQNTCMMYNYKNHVLSTTINRNIVFVTISSCILDNKKGKIRELME